MMKKSIKVLAIMLIISLFTTVSVFADMSYSYKLTTISNTITKPYGMVNGLDGNIYISSLDTHQIHALHGEQMTAFAGWDVYDLEGNRIFGLYDSSVETALFYAPSGMDMDADGNLYVADSENHAIRKITQDGNVMTIAGDGVLGARDGNGEAARFYQPMDVAVADDGTIYVADTLNHIIRKISSNGDVTTLTKQPDRLIEVDSELVINGGDYLDGNIEDALFNEPASIVIDHAGNLIVSDSGNHVIRYIDFAADEVTTIAGTADRSDYADDTLYLPGGHRDGALTNAAFKTPKGLTLTKDGNVLVVDSGNRQIRLLHLEKQTVQSLLKQGDLLDPSHVSMTNTGELLITDTRNHQLKKITFTNMPDGFGDYEKPYERYEDEADIADYALEAVYELQRLGIMIGTSEQRFSPKQPLTRAQFAKLMVEALKLDGSDEVELFTDVAPDEWYTLYIEIAAANGIVNGYADGTFRPNQSVTRQEIALMIGRAMDWTAQPTETIYIDQASIWDEALPAVVVLRDRHIMNGDDRDRFNPQQTVTRDMGAVVIYRLLKDQ